MLGNQDNFKNFLHTTIEIAKADKLDELVDLLVNSSTTIEESGYDNWNGGIYYYTVLISIDVKRFVTIRDQIEAIESKLLELFKLSTKHIQGEIIGCITIIPFANAIPIPAANPHRPFSPSELKVKECLINYLSTASEDELIEEVLLPLFRQLGFHRITVAGHKDKALEYGKDLWMKYTLPTQHILYFGVQAKKGKLDASGNSKGTNNNIAEIHNQLTMMLGHEIFDPEIGKRVLVDHAFIIAGGEITKAARNWIGGMLDTSKRSQILFIDKDDILNLFIVNNVPLPMKAIPELKIDPDDLPF